MERFYSVFFNTPSACERTAKIPFPGGCGEIHPNDFEKFLLHNGLTMHKQQGGIEKIVKNRSVV